MFQSTSDLLRIKIGSPSGLDLANTAHIPKNPENRLKHHDPFCRDVSSA